MKRRMVFLVSAVLVGFASVVVWYSGSDRPGISLECYEKIEEGMTRQQVEAILGGPPRWEVEPPHYLIRLSGQRVPKWWGRSGVITVVFRENGVSWKSFEPLPFEPKPPTLWEIMFPWSRKVLTLQ